MSRLHFDAASGFGLWSWSEGWCHLIDLSDEDSARQRNRPVVDLRPLLFPQGQPLLVEMSDGDFHAMMAREVGNQDGALFHTLRFYKMSDDECCHAVFGCDSGAWKRVREGLRLALTIAMGPSGELAGCKSARWHPWATGVEALHLHRTGSRWTEGEAPAKLAGMMELICTRMGCRMRIEPEESNDGVKSLGASHARTVTLEWAANLCVRSKQASAHVAMEAAVQLGDMLR